MNYTENETYTISQSTEENASMFLASLNKGCRILSGNGAHHEIIFYESDDSNIAL